MSVPANAIVCMLPWMKETQEAIGLGYCRLIWPKHRDRLDRMNTIASPTVVRLPPEEFTRIYRAFYRPEFNFAMPVRKPCNLLVYIGLLIERVLTKQTLTFSIRAGGLSLTLSPWQRSPFIGLTLISANGGMSASISCTSRIGKSNPTQLSACTERERQRVDGSSRGHYFRRLLFAQPTSSQNVWSVRNVHVIDTGEL